MVKKIGCGFEDKTSGKLNFNPGVIKIEDEKNHFNYKY